LPNKIKDNDLAISSYKSTAYFLNARLYFNFYYGPQNLATITIGGTTRFII
jgi:hypothetical protein